jgi:hypothetical protein
MSEMITPKEIWINVWKNSQEQIILLYPTQIPFNDSPTTNKKWKLNMSFKAFNPMIRPFPRGTQLYVAKHYSHYPYNLKEVITPEDNFDIDEIPNNDLDKDTTGTYFVVYNVPFSGLKRIPINNNNMDIFIYSSDIKYFK